MAETRRKIRPVHSWLDAAAIVCAALVAWVFYDVVMDDATPLSIGLPKIISLQPIPRNGALTISYDVTVERLCSGVGQRVFVDASHVPFPAFAFFESTGRASDSQVLSAGARIRREVKVPVPYGMAPGTATYQNHAVFYCNFWQRVLRQGIAFDYPEIRFQVDNSSLPEVAPSSSIFKMTPRPMLGPIEWVRWYLDPRRGDVP